jgi:hypothetical protein
VHGKVPELAGHHTASRIIQFCAKYGSEAQRSAIMAEVRASMVELSKGKHGHHLVQKLIAMSKKEEVPGKRKGLNRVGINTVIPWKHHSRDVKPGGDLLLCALGSWPC